MALFSLVLFLHMDIVVNGLGDCWQLLASMLWCWEGMKAFGSLTTYWSKIPVIDFWPLLSDQTPTPTRFLKNCEEVGLFSELDCSFEHEFRKTQEEENSKRVGGPGWTVRCASQHHGENVC